MRDALLDRLYQLKVKPTGISEWSVVTLWREGYSTAEIAQQLGSSEPEVYNKLAAIRERSRHGA
jgi:DNA-binding NarL/FixJ family response regulator